ncbi:3-deoxy-8-phosphooctulonate synthase [bacterium]|nr:3-deoxy-8-phosphooctulonate synthase [bacterium]
MIRLKNITIGRDFFIVAGPCSLESEDVAISVAEELGRLEKEYNIPFIFKGSYKKANRLSATSYRGPGMDKGMRILSLVKEKYGFPVLTDIHTPNEAKPVSEVADIIQIPAFLCRQTELIESAARTGKPINIKKGQFLSPEDMRFAAEKAKLVGNDNVIFTERGTFFGYRDLVVDFRSIIIMKSLGYPVLFDATHSFQTPGGRGGSSGGRRDFSIPFAKVAAVLGVDGIYIETHPTPDEALSDSAVMLPLHSMERLVAELRKILSIRE